MLKLIALAALTLAAQDAPKAAQSAPPKQHSLTEVEALKLENIQIRFEVIVAGICQRVGLTPQNCAVDPRSGMVYERPAPPAPKPEVKK